MSEADLLPLVSALGDGEWHSGERLAARAGITRAGLAKRIERLREWGLVIDSRHGLGYRLEAPLDPLDEAALRRACPALRLTVAARLASTNASLLAADPAADPQALLAESQSAGRGRQGRTWVSPYGRNLYLSLAWSFPAWPPAITALPLQVGVSVATALTAQGLSRLRLKWPNDLVIEQDGGWRKLGGILIEQRGEAGGSCRVVIGIGLNHAMSTAQATAIEQPWISLAEALAAEGRPLPRRTVVASAVLGQLQADLPRFAREGFAAARAHWLALDATRDRAVRLLSAGAAISGIARGVDAQGALLLDTAEGLRPQHAGDLSLRLDP
ncbi:MAG TPA: biotin--[acetyl-CoA-carboxylase] ligase [Nevskiaceae bacterium]|nr:biotin--[acetyl-CoA-carboxylase] ligase [Nevskiaceae bacterium]